MNSTADGHDPAEGSQRSPEQPSHDDAQSREEFCVLLGYEFNDAELFDLALRHRSWCAENDTTESNERLEFLGDAVLGLVITEYLYLGSPDTSEGVLARYRSELVSAVALAGLARELGLGDVILLGKGEESTGGREKTSILADAMEAVFGAMYLDGGIDGAGPVLLRLFERRLAAVVDEGYATDHKSRLQELAAQRFGQLPRYRLHHDGPEHEKIFWARVEVGGVQFGKGQGRTKKEAEQAAADMAFQTLQDYDPNTKLPPKLAAEDSEDSNNTHNSPETAHPNGELDASTPEKVLETQQVDSEELPGSTMESERVENQAELEKMRGNDEGAHHA